jgi:hypothetical protein
MKRHEVVAGLLHYGQGHNVTYVPCFRNRYGLRSEPPLWSVGKPQLCLTTPRVSLLPPVVL